MKNAKRTDLPSPLWLLSATGHIYYTRKSPKFETMPRGEERKRPLGGIGDLSSWAQSVAPQLSILVWGAAVVRFHATDATENQTANETACQTDTPSSIGIERPAAVARKYFKGMFGRAVSGGPENLEPMDLLFLAVIIILALEFLSLLVKKSGREYQTREAI